MSCPCEYPCSCVIYDGRQYSSWGSVVRALEQRLDYASSTHKLVRRRLEAQKAGLAREVVDHNHRIADLCSSLRFADEKIARQHNHITDLEHEIEALATEPRLRELDERLDSFRKDNASLARQLQVKERLCAVVLNGRDTARDERDTLRRAIRKHRDTDGQIYRTHDLELYRAAQLPKTGAAFVNALRTALKDEPRPYRAARGI